MLLFCSGFLDHCVCDWLSRCTSSVRWVYNGLNTEPLTERRGCSLVSQTHHLGAAAAPAHRASKSHDDERKFRSPDQGTANMPGGRGSNLDWHQQNDQSPNNQNQIWCVTVMVSPLACSGVIICAKCPLIIPGRRYLSYRLPGGVILSPLCSECIRRESN